MHNMQFYGSIRFAYFQARLDCQFEYNLLTICQQQKFNMDHQKYSDDIQKLLNSDIIEEQQILSDGQIKINRYFKKAQVGAGVSSKCYQVIQQATGQIYVAKVITNQSLRQRKAKRRVNSHLQSEIDIHKQLNHPNIVQFHRNFSDEENNYLILEMCQGQNLRELLKNKKILNYKEVRYYLFQIINALKYLHDKHVIHRDLCLENIFLDSNMNAKIGDFGLAAQLDPVNQLKRSNCGSNKAPQILNKSGYSFQVDIWALGTIIYHLLIGQPPFKTISHLNTQQIIRKGKYELPQKLSLNATNLIKSILQLDREKRSTLSQILESPFFQQSTIPTKISNKIIVYPSQVSCKQNQQKRLEVHQWIRLNKEGKTQTVQKGQKKSQIILQREDISAEKEQIHKKKRTLGYYRPKDPVILSKRFQIQDKVHIINFNFKEEAVGYLLSDGSIGVYIKSQDGIKCNKDSDQFSIFSEKQSKSYKFMDYPNERVVIKKISLLNHFRNSLLLGVNSKHFSNSDHEQVYVKKCAKTKIGMIFKLSNQLYQCDFDDDVKILLSKTQIRYTDFLGVSTSYARKDQTLIGSDIERRVNDIVTHWKT